MHKVKRLLFQVKIITVLGIGLAIVMMTLNFHRRGGSAVAIDKPLLFCFDFGGTLIQGCLTDCLNKCSTEAEKIDAAEAFFKDPTRGWVGGKAVVSDLFKKILAAGHHIAITSFGLHIEIVKKHILGLEIPEDKIFILRCKDCDLKRDYPQFPLISDDPQGKARSISVAMAHFGIDVKEVNRVILIDDRQRNIGCAEKDRIRTILADGTVAFYQACLEIIGGSHSN